MLAVMKKLTYDEEYNFENEVRWAVFPLAVISAGGKWFGKDSYSLTSFPPTPADAAAPTWQLLHPVVVVSPGCLLWVMEQLFPWSPWYRGGGSYLDLQKLTSWPKATWTWTAGLGLGRDRGYRWC